MMSKKNERVLSEAQAAEILRDAAIRIQRIDESIKQLQTEKRDIIKNVKEEGLNVQALKDAIRRIRKAKKEPQLEQEIELYEDYIENYINPI